MTKNALGLRIASCFASPPSESLHVRHVQTVQQEQVVMVLGCTRRRSGGAGCWTRAGNAHCSNTPRNGVYGRSIGRGFGFRRFLLFFLGAGIQLEFLFSICHSEMFLLQAHWDGDGRLFWKPARRGRRARRRAECRSAAKEARTAKGSAASTRCGGIPAAHFPLQANWIPAQKKVV